MTSRRRPDEPGRLGQDLQALLRIASLATDGSAPNEVFEAVAAEAAAWVDAAGASLIRFESECEYMVVGSCAGPTSVGTRTLLGAGDDGVIAEILRTERAPPGGGRRDAGPAESLTGAHDGPEGLGVPLIVDNRLWGVLQVTTGGPRPSGATVSRLHNFVRLVTAAVANASARGELDALVDERASLRRIHAVAGSGGTGADVLTAVTAEGSAWLDGVSTSLVRLDGDGTSTVVASTGRAAQLTESHRADEADLIAAVVRSQAPTRVDAGRAGERAPAHTCVGVPISVAGGIWGVLVATSPGRMPPQAEHRLAHFAEAITPTILSAQARTRLAQEQIALRRVAELVARGAGADDVFTLVVQQTSGFTRGTDVTATRWEGPDLQRVIAAHGARAPAPGAPLEDAGGSESRGR